MRVLWIPSRNGLGLGGYWRYDTEMQEPPFKRRHCLITSQLSILEGELSPTKRDPWAILVLP